MGGYKNEDGAWIAPPGLPQSNLSEVVEPEKPETTSIEPLDFFNQEISKIGKTDLSLALELQGAMETYLDLPGKKVVEGILTKRTSVNYDQLVFLGSLIDRDKNSLELDSRIADMFLNIIEEYKTRVKNEG